MVTSNMVLRSPSDFLVLTVILALSVLLSTNAKQVGYPEKPQFTYMEKSVVEVKFKNAVNSKDGKAVNRSVHICCTCDDFYNGLCEAMCSHQSQCPKFKKLENCKSDGPVKYCQISHVMIDVTFKAFVSEKDSENNTITSGVATYVTNDSTKVPRPVSNLNITYQGSDLYLQWPLSNIYTITTMYSHVVYCQAVERKNAKAFRDMVGFFQSSVIVSSFNISGATKYQCCVQVETVLTSVLSKRTCRNITSPEQAPSLPPVILCGNDTVCPFVIKGSLRNVTIPFKLPDVNDRNGKLVRHLIIYQNENDANVTTLVLNNGSATEVQLVGLYKNSSYIIYMKSCTDVGCSPSSKAIRIPAINDDINDNRQRAKVIIIITTAVLAVIVVVVGILWFLRRHRIQGKRGSLPQLDLKTHLEYDYPVNNAGEDLYHNLRNVVAGDREPSVHSAENVVAIEDDREK